MGGPGSGWRCSCSSSGTGSRASCREPGPPLRPAGEDRRELASSGQAAPAALPALADRQERGGRGPRRCREVWTGRGDRHTQGQPRWKARCGAAGREPSRGAAHRPALCSPRGFQELIPPGVVTCPSRVRSVPWSEVLRGGRTGRREPRTASEPSSEGRSLARAAAHTSTAFRSLHGGAPSAASPRVGASRAVSQENPRCASLPAAFPPCGSASHVGEWEACRLRGFAGGRGRSLSSRHRSPRGSVWEMDCSTLDFIRPAVPAPSAECHQLVIDPRRRHPGAVTHLPFWWSM